MKKISTRSSQQPEWIQNVSLQLDADFLRVQQAVAAGLKAALGVPIIASINRDSGQEEAPPPQSPAQVLAVLLFFISESRKEDKRMVELVSAIAAQLGSVLQRKQAEVALQKSLSQLGEANQEITSLNQRLKAENVRMRAELAVTRQLQQMILPKDYELSQVEGLEIAGFMEPADEVGGDYYDVLWHNGGVKIGIGDVTGHGIESGVLMIMMQTAVRALLFNNETDPVKFLSVLNQTIYGNVQRMNSDKNLSLSLLDYKEGTLRLSGQHEEMIVVRARGAGQESSAVVERIDTLDLGFPVGLVADIRDFVFEAKVQLKPGDVVVLYTDGITEAEDVQGRQYGLERLCEIVSHNWHVSAGEIRRIVIEDVREHVGEQKIYDDITLLVFKQK